jgi:hypothetical protein
MPHSRLDHDDAAMGMDCMVNMSKPTTAMTTTTTASPFFDDHSRSKHVVADTATATQTTSRYFRERIAKSSTVVVSPETKIHVRDNANATVGSNSTSNISRSDCFVDSHCSSSSVSACVVSLGPSIFTWMSNTVSVRECQRRRVVKLSKREKKIDDDGPSVLATSICQPCRDIVDNVRKQFDGCPLFYHHMDDLIKEEEANGIWACYEENDESSCAIRIGQRMKDNALRHLCRQQCYLRSFGSFRDWTIFRKALHQHLSGEGDDDNKSVTHDVDQLLKGWTCRLVHPDDEEDESNAPKTKRRKPQKRDTAASSKSTMTDTQMYQNAPNTEFVSTISGKRYKSPALAIRGLVVAIRKADPNGKNYQVPAKTESQEETKKRRLNVARRLSHSDSSSLSIHDHHKVNGSHHPSSQLASPSECRSDVASSPLGLLEELFVDNPWRLLLCTIFLNRTQRKQVDSLLFQFLRRWPNPETVVKESMDDTQTAVLENEIATLLLPMGLRKRSLGIIRFCHDFVALKRDKTQERSDGCTDENDAKVQSPPEFLLTRKEVKSLFFCGDYAADAYAMFIRNDFSCLLSNDHALVAYTEYRRSKSLTSA